MDEKKVLQSIPLMYKEYSWVNNHPAFYLGRVAYAEMFFSDK